jgi:hypothetical protein
MASQLSASSVACSRATKLSDRHEMLPRTWKPAMVRQDDLRRTLTATIRHEADG